jgi:ribonucleoside-diphosphate reductase alpha chain
VTCNIASINVAKVFTAEHMKETVPVMMRILDNVVTITKYPLKEAERTSLRYRPVALGYLGLAEYFATHLIAYDSQEARDIADKMFEEFAWHVYRTSIDLAKESVEAMSSTLDLSTTRGSSSDTMKHGIRQRRA